MSFADVPGFASVTEERGETTVVIETAQLREASNYLRDERGFNFLSDIAAADYLGWNERTVAGYWGHRDGRDINRPGSWGLAKKPEPKAKRFSVSYHLVSVVSGAREAPRVRLQVWCDEGESVPSVVSVWPTADWHEREAYDLMGIEFEGHPNLKRILMYDEFVGHPLRKDYPVDRRQPLIGPVN